MMNGIISLVSDFSIACVIEGRVSLAHLMEFSHFVDLYVLEDQIYLEGASIDVNLTPFKDDTNCPLKEIKYEEYPELAFAVAMVSDRTLDIYNAAPRNYTFSMESYEYWTTLSQKEKQSICHPADLKTEEIPQRKGLLSYSNSLNRYIQIVLEELGKTTFTLMPSSRNLVPFLEVFHQTETPALLLYSIVAGAHRKVIEGVLALARPRMVYLPPLLSILLSRCSNRSEIPYRLIELRSEFADFRHSVTEWFNELDQAESLRDKCQIRDELDNTIVNLVKHYENKRRGFYKQVAGAFVSAAEDGDLKKMLTKPAFALIKEGVTSVFPEMLSVRRFTGLIDLMDQALDISNYSSLVSRIFGDSYDVSQQEITEAKRYTQYLQTKYKIGAPLIS